MKRSDAILWVVGVATFGIGDLATTAVGASEGAIEVNPFGAEILSAYGFAGAIGVKLAFFAVIVGMYYAVETQPLRSGIASAVAIIGLIVLGWNILVLLLVM